MTSVKQSRKDPEVEVRSAALATQELSVHEVTKSHLAHAPNHICENSGLEVQERPHPPVPPLMLTPTNQTDSHQQDYVCSTSLCVSEDSTSKYEHRVSEHPTDTDLQEVLEGADSILYEAKEDIRYLKGCKSVRFFRSADGTPSLSLHKGKCRFPTPIALRTRARSRHDT